MHAKPYPSRMHKVTATGTASHQYGSTVAAAIWCSLQKNTADSAVSLSCSFRGDRFSAGSRMMNTAMSVDTFLLM